MPCVGAASTISILVTVVTLNAVAELNEVASLLLLVAVTAVTAVTAEVVAVALAVMTVVVVMVRMVDVEAVVVFGKETAATAASLVMDNCLLEIFINNTRYTFPLVNWHQKVRDFYRMGKNSD